MKIVTFEKIETNQPEILAHLCRHNHKAVMAIHNLSKKALKVSLKLPGFPVDQIRQIQNHHKYKTKSNGDIEIEVPAYGYSWWRLI